MIIGVEDHLQLVDTNIWVYGMRNESARIPRFYPQIFEITANRLLSRCLHIQRDDITAHNWESIYKYLIHRL